MSYLGDVEEGIGNSHGPPVHPANAATHVPGVTAADDEKPASPTAPEDEMQQTSNGDKSVLQAKLTNLAIQIGYGGMDDTLFNHIYLIND